jgi:methyl-accepting chemotaxis protein
MQMHDMTRQQVEHIVEALERLSVKLHDSIAVAPDPDIYRKLIIEAGDVCELQSAQLRFASTELCGAVLSIVDNLRDVASKQSLMASESLSTTGVADSSGGSFMDAMSRGMGTVTAVLASCAKSDREMSTTLSKVADTMQEVSGFVTDIEDIGSEIDLIALNSQVKAAHTGKDGAALGVLAEAIKRLSDDAIIQTGLVSKTLTEVNQSTEHLFNEASEETEQLSIRITTMEQELSEILAALGSMNSDLMGLLSTLGQRVGMLTEDIERVTATIDVHERVTRMANDAMTSLDKIVAKARELEPASLEFKDNLRHMEERYTMDSERHIHESIARKRSGGSSGNVAETKVVSATVSDSEFGDNVDLF